MGPVASTLMDTGRTVAAGLGATLSGPKRLLILLISYWTFFHVVAIGLTLGIPWALFRWRLLAGLLLLYLVPPLTARIIRCLAPIGEGALWRVAPALGCPGWTVDLLGSRTENSRPLVSSHRQWRHLRSRGALE